MTTVSNSFKGYQYYEFALLKDLTPESRKLAEQTSQSFDANEDSPAEVAARQPENLLPEEEIDKQLDNLFSTGDAGPVDGGSSDRSLDDLFSASTLEDKEMDVFQPFEKAPNAEASKPSEDADFLKDILSLGAHTPNFFDEPTSPQRTSAVGSGNGDSLFRVNWDNHLSDVFSSARTEGSSQSQPMEMPHDMGGLQAPSQQKLQPSASAKPTSTPKKPESGDIEAWMKFFADLTPLGNPDQQSTKKGHVLDA